MIWIVLKMHYKLHPNPHGSTRPWQRSGRRSMLQHKREMLLQINSSPGKIQKNSTTDHHHPSMSIITHHRHLSQERKKEEEEQQKKLFSRRPPIYLLLKLAFFSSYTIPVYKTNSCLVQNTATHADGCHIFAKDNKKETPTHRLTHWSTADHRHTQTHTNTRTPTYNYNIFNS